jgi:hypothetical protein
VVATGTVTQQDGVVVEDGIVRGAPREAIRADTWNVTFSTTSQDVNLEPDSQASLTPGGFRNVVVKSRSTLTLAAGTYTFESLSLEPEATLTVNNASGPTHIFIRSSMTVRGAIASSVPNRFNVRFSFAGTSPVALEAPFLGTLVAPAAAVNLASVAAPGHRGAILAKSIEIHQWTTFEHRPFRDEVCSAPGQCRPVTPKPSSAREAGISKTLAWKTRNRSGVGLSGAS